MKLKTKAAIIALMCLIFLAFATGCSIKTTPYETNDKDNYTVSVKFDANGGTFDVNTSVIVDSYNPDELPVGKDGKAEIALVAPEDSTRTESFEATRTDYFFVGWYETRTEVKGENGEIEYQYSNKWDFEKDRVQVDTNEKHTSSEPVKTLYAAWIPLFEVQICDKDTGKKIDTIKFNPLDTNEFTLPQWNEETGALDMNDLPKRKDFTLVDVYLDKDADKPVDGESIIHPGDVNYENATAVSPVLKVYTTWKEGNWFRIETAKQFVDNLSVSGCYEILADLDFAEVSWKDNIAQNAFTGSIIGNGHTMKNISIDRSNSTMYTGLFGIISENATVCDITFENVTVTLGARVSNPGTAIGILAGSISDSATVENVVLKDSALLIGKDNNDRDFNIATKDYSMGLVCGLGDLSGVTGENLVCAYVEDVTGAYDITVDGNEVILTKIESTEE